MSNKWQVGAVYRLKYDSDFVSDNTYANSKIFNKIGLNDFTVVEINEQGRVNLIKTVNGLIRPIDLDLLYLFRDSELQYFEIVLPNTQNNTSRDTNNIITDWLNKYATVYQSGVIDTMKVSADDGVYLFTDNASFYTAEDIVVFINNMYTQLQNTSTQKKELQDKRQALLDELAKLDKQLEGL